MAEPRIDITEILEQLPPRCAELCPEALKLIRLASSDNNEVVAEFAAGCLSALAQTAVKYGDKGPWDSADRSPGPYWHCSITGAHF